MNPKLERAYSVKDSGPVKHAGPSYIPYLTRGRHSTQLMVNGSPFLILGAELQNSSFSSSEYMQSIWPALVDAHVNTVLASVSWEMIEPTEGTFDFTELDQSIQDARRYGLRLVLLWFGTFKNALSSYVPAWVKTNNKRFPRAKLRKAGGVIETADALSVFHPEAAKADAKAFGRLMRHIRELDEAHSTVIMVQVQNEVGILGDSRDGCTKANNIFSDPVPEDLTTFLKNDWARLSPDLKANLQNFNSGGSSGNWAKVFGKSAQTDEIFMAYHYARFVDQVAAAGKQEYAIPLYTNVWQNYLEDSSDSTAPIVAGGGNQPGTYPSGGGTSNVLDIWMHFAPHLDFIAPDIYLNDYVMTCSKYCHRQQPLFIPEQRRDDYGARRVWSAFGSYKALGTAPFGIDTIDQDSNPWKKHYGLLSRVRNIVLEAQRRPNSSIGFFFDEINSDGTDPSKPVTARFHNFDARIERSFVFGKPTPGAGMVIHLSATKFLLIGYGFQAVFKSTLPDATFTGILSMKEKEVVNAETGEMKTARILNGDETHSGQCCIMPSESPDYGDFSISITIPARTMIAEVEVYVLTED